MPETFEQFRSRVVKAAQQRSGKKSICIDNLEQYYPDKFEKAVNHAIDNTAWWDGDWLPK